MKNIIKKQQKTIFIGFMSVALFIICICTVCTAYAADKDNAKTPVDIPGLTYDHSMELSYAEEFSVDYYNDGYAAVQLGFQDKKEKHTTKPLMGHFKRAGVTPKRHLAEFKEFETELNLGDTVTVELFNDANFVDVVGTSKGKGFQGVVKRHGFGGVGQTTHGQHNRARKPGSIGACSYPAKVFKGMRMGGQLGGDRVTVQNLQVLKVIADHNLLLIKGSIPGCKGSIVLIEK